MDSLQGRAPTRNAPFEVKKTAELGRVAAPNSSFSITDGIGKLLSFVGPTVVTIIGTIVYVLGILIPGKVFGEEGYVIPKYVATAVSVFIPGSGLVITPVFFGLRAFAERLQPVLDAAAQKQSF